MKEEKTRLLGGIFAVCKNIIFTFLGFWGEMKVFCALGVSLCLTVGTASAATLGSLVIADRDFADGISSLAGAINTYISMPDGSADLNTLSPSEAGSGSNVGQGIFCTADCSFDVDFLDNSIINGSGFDLVVFEGGGNEPLAVTLNSVRRELSTSDLVLEVGFEDIAGFQVGYWLLDLDDFGVSSGESISSFTVDLLYDEARGTDFASGDFVAASGLTPPSEIPLPAGLPLLLSGVLALSIARRNT